jgi:hypothetical protein
MVKCKLNQLKSPTSPWKMESCQDCSNGNVNLKIFFNSHDAIHKEIISKRANMNNERQYGKLSHTSGQ